MTRRVVMSVVALAAALTWLPSTAEAQSSITGIVKDSSGAVMPGVTVEAASDALIEKVKSAVTDGNGVYRIVDLRPGTYSVTFTLAGFQTVRREGIMLAAEFTATVNTDLRVGELAETITVTGQSPIVDTTTAVHTQVLDRSAIEELPSGRMIQSIGQLIPGINLSLPDVGGARAMQQTYMNTHGMTAANNTVLVDGMTVNGLQGDGAIQQYHNEATNQEMSYQTSGINADTSAGGVRLNMIPREGGNRFSGDFRYSTRPGDWQSSNLTDRHVAAGLQSGNAIDRIIDATFSQGGPIRRDRLWFFVSAKYNSVNTKIANTFFDDGSQGIDDQFIRQASARLTWQMSGRNKLSAYFDEIDKYRGHDMQSGFDPEEASLQWFSPAYHTAQVKWTSTVSSRMLLEAGWSSNIEYYTNSYRPGVEQPRGTAAWFAGATRLDNLQAVRGTAAASQTTQSPERQNLQASISYVTGSHNFKFGVQYTWGDFLHTLDANADLTQQYRSPVGTPAYSVPDSVVIRNTPLVYGERLNRDLGFYAQDSWKLNKLTINAGVRWENVVAQVLAGESPAGRFVPARTFAEIKDLPNWSDWAPRFAMVYDLFGNGKTALKYSLNRYNQSRTTGIAADYNPLVSATATLPWRDVNGNDIAEGARGCTGYPSVGCEINFQTLATNFGTAALNEYGAYPRTWNLESALELQHEIMPRLSGTASWFRGNFHNLTTTINRSYTHADFTPYTVYNPLTAEPIQVFARTLEARPTRNLDTFDPDRKREYESFNFEFNSRPGRGIFLFGGLAVERELNVNCTAPDDPNTLRFCDDRENGVPYRKNFKLSGSVPLPWGVNVSAVFQSNNGVSSSRTLAATRGTTTYPTNCPAPCPAGQIILPSNIFGQSLTVALVDGDTVYTDRINQLDVRFGRTFEFGRIRVVPSLEIFNINNSDAIISYASTNALNTGSSYLRPNSIMQPRMIGFNVQTRW
jgi:Carboxypeptidase regulatory-like domain/TonB-dependent Receptor Plug Domain